MMMAAIGLAVVMLMLKAINMGNTSSDMESAKGSSPSSSYSYELQIFHAF